MPFKSKDHSMFVITHQKTWNSTGKNRTGDFSLDAKFYLTFILDNFCLEKLILTFAPIIIYNNSILNNKSRKSNDSVNNAWRITHFYEKSNFSGATLALLF
jgi:hypothetical protein